MKSTFKEISNLVSFSVRVKKVFEITSEGIIYSVYHTPGLFVVVSNRILLKYLRSVSVNHLLETP